MLVLGGMRGFWCGIVGLLCSEGPGRAEGVLKFLFLMDWRFLRGCGGFCRIGLWVELRCIYILVLLYRLIYHGYFQDIAQ